MYALLVLTPHQLASDASGALEQKELEIASACVDTEPWLTACALTGAWPHSYIPSTSTVVVLTVTGVEVKDAGLVVPDAIADADDAAAGGIAEAEARVLVKASTSRTKSLTVSFTSSITRSISDSRTSTPANSLSISRSATESRSTSRTPTDSKSISRSATETPSGSPRVVAAAASSSSHSGWADIGPGGQAGIALAVIFVCFACFACLAWWFLVRNRVRACAVCCASLSLSLSF